MSETAKIPSVSTLLFSLRKESDRGCALIAASMLDTALERYLRARFVDEKGVVNEVLGQNRPLGTFSSRIDLAYLVGGIPKEVHRDLHLIRKIRNKFGHTMNDLSFDSEEVKPQCLEIQSSVLDGKSARANFTQAAISIMGFLDGARERTKRCEVDNTLDLEIYKTVLKQVFATMLFDSDFDFFDQRI